MTWARQICKLVIYCSTCGFILILFAEFGLPIIFDYIWRVPESPSKSLEAILSHRIELRNLETELNMLLRATNNPVNDHGITGQEEIAQQYEEYFEAIEDYTKDYGKFEHTDLERFIQSNEKISKKLDEFVKKHEKVSAERNEFLLNIARRVTKAAETTTLKSVWTLLKHFDIMAEYGIVLDAEQPKHEFDDENSNLSEDDECIQVLQNLLNLMNEADQLSKRVIQTVSELNAQLTEEVLPPNGSTIDVEEELNYFHEKSIRLKKEMVNLVKTNKQLIGKTNLMIFAASQRVSNLGAKVIEKEGKVWMEEMNTVLIKLRGKAAKAGQLTQKLTANVNLRIAPDLDQEEDDLEELLDWDEDADDHEEL